MAGCATRQASSARRRRSGVLQGLQRALPGALADHVLDPVPARPAAGAGPGGGGDGLDRVGAVFDRRAYPVTRYRTADTREHAVATPLTGLVWLGYPNFAVGESRSGIEKRRPAAAGSVIE